MRCRYLVCSRFLSLTGCRTPRPRPLLPVASLPSSVVRTLGSYHWLVSAQAQLGDAKAVLASIAEMGRNGCSAGEQFHNGRAKSGTNALCGVPRATSCAPMVAVEKRVNTDAVARVLAVRALLPRESPSTRGARDNSVELRSRWDRSPRIAELTDKPCLHAEYRSIRVSLGSCSFFSLAAEPSVAECVY